MSEPDSASPNLAAPRDMTRVIAFDATGPVNQPALDTLEFFRQSLVVTDARRDPADPGRLRITLSEQPATRGLAFASAPGAPRELLPDIALPPAPPREGSRALRILCLHGVHHQEGLPLSEQPWIEAIQASVASYGAPAADIRWVPYNQAFEDAHLDPGDVLESAAKLAAAGAWYGLGDLFRTRAFTTARGLGDTLRWTAGMVVQWSENEALRAALRDILRTALGDPDWRADILLAHSLGSLIAYDTLARQEAAATRAARDLTLVTFGSQIGFPAVRAAFGGRIVPIAGLRQWFHLYNRRDHAFTAPLDVRFPAGEARPNFVQCATEFDVPNDPLNHDAREYLRHCETRRLFWRYAAEELAGAWQTGPGSLRVRAIVSAAGTRAPMVVKARDRRFARALLVGISRYPRPEDCLEGCVSDTFLVSELLQEAGFQAANIRLLLDERATAAAIRDRLAWLLDGTDDGQDRVFFYAGHGAQVPAYGAGEVVDHRDECLAPHDFDWGNRDTAVTDDWFNDLYSQLPIGSHFLAALDCCHSGGMTRQGGMRARGLTPPDDIRHRLLQWTGRGGEFVDRATSEPQDRLRQERRRREELFGVTGDVHGLGRAVALRLPRAKFDAARRVFGHKGPFLPVLLEACREQELAHELRIGPRSHGAFTWCLAETLREGNRSAPLTWTSLVTEVGRRLEARGFAQRPLLVCPRALKHEPVTWLVKAGRGKPARTPRRAGR